MQVSQFMNGGYVIHGITGNFKGKVSAWFKGDGKLLDAQQIIRPFGLNPSEHQVKRDGPIWKLCETIGHRYKHIPASATAPQTKYRFLRSGVDRIVHVIAKELHSGNPCIGIRNATDPESVPSLKVHHAEIVVGTGTYIHIHRTPDNPVPGTDGRGVCPLRTDAELKIYED